MIIFLLILIIAILSYIAFVLALCWDILIKMKVDTDVLLDVVTEKTAKNVASKLKEEGYIALKKEYECRK